MRLMTNYTDSELEFMMTDLETDRIERKESFSSDAHNRIREAICAFANDLPNNQLPGVLFIGAKDNGTPSGLAITDSLLQSLADTKDDGNIVPPPSFSVTKRLLHGAEIAVVLVESSDNTPVRYNGRIHIRVGPRRAIATAQDERILNQKRRFKDLPFDAQAVRPAGLADLDRRYFEESYLPSAFAPDILEANDRTYEQRLASTKMIFSVDDTTPTTLGILVLGVHPVDFLPGAYLQFLKIDGIELSDSIIDELMISGKVQDVLRRIDDKIVSHNRVAVDFTSSAKELRKEDYPLVALQQLIRNAVMHRSYEQTNAPIRVSWYSDRIEIISPGGPFGLVNIENFGEPGVADYRNPNLAEAMRVLGFVQRIGMGIPTARKELDRNGNPPMEFSITQQFVRIILRKAR